VAIFRQQLDILDRQIQLGAFGVFQQQAFVRRSQRLDHLEPCEPPHAVIDMDDQIAR